MMSHHRWLFGVVMRHFRFAARAFLLLAATGIFSGTRSAADTFTWTGASPNIVGIANNWSNPLNWQGGQIPDNDGTADVVIPDTPRDNPNVNTAWSIATLTFEGAGNYSVNGSTLTLNDITHNGTGTVTFNNSVDVSGSGALWRGGEWADHIRRRDQRHKFSHARSHAPDYVRWFDDQYAYRDSYR